MPSFPSTAPQDDSHPSSLCILAWLSVQTGALALAALRVPLWARASGSEFVAMEILISIQILASALLFPRLTDGWQATLIAIATAWPFLVLAGLLASRLVPTILYAGLYLTAWLLLLSIWRSCCSTEREKWVASTLAATWAVGGPVLMFIRSEYRLDAPQPPTPLPAAVLGPLCNAFTLLDPTISAGKATIWACLIIPALLGGGTLWVKRFAFRQN